MFIGSQFTLMSLQSNCLFTISNKLVTVPCFCEWCRTDAGVACGMGHRVILPLCTPSKGIQLLPFQLSPSRHGRFLRNPGFVYSVEQSRADPARPQHARSQTFLSRILFLTDEFSRLTHFDLSTVCTHDSVGSLFTGVFTETSRLPTLLLSSVFYGSTVMCLLFPICLFYFSCRFCILKTKIFILLFFPLVSLVFIYFCLILFSSSTYSFRSLLF